MKKQKIIQPEKIAVGISVFVEIGNYLWYDAKTRIVYLWNGCRFCDHATTPSPYYAPNGHPYRYDPETKTFEEIQKN